MKNLLLLFLTLITCSAFAQNDKPQSRLDAIGLETQVYPAGNMVNLKASWLSGERGRLIGKLGYNFARRKDFGKHDLEEGGGPGLAVAYRQYFNHKWSNFFIEGRASTWFLDIDWQDNSPSRMGNTDITVFQPTLAIGYDWATKNDKINFNILIGFGYEVNVITSGEGVGEGGISLLGLSVDFRL
ncbi:hypothetical protein [Roseivirga sp.]|uniref:hypothetical protein n=1 Tax=Roseivirga sp. TaxID=1964215 RepID=UPI003B8C3337